jgi:hypothetical protein
LRPFSRQKKKLKVSVTALPIALRSGTGTGLLLSFTKSLQLLWPGFINQMYLHNIAGESP